MELKDKFRHHHLIMMVHHKKLDDVLTLMVEAASAGMNPEPILELAINPDYGFEGAKAVAMAMHLCGYSFETSTRLWRQSGGLV